MKCVTPPRVITYSRSTEEDGRYCSTIDLTFVSRQLVSRIDHFEQGAGLVNAIEAVDYRRETAPSIIHLNDLTTFLANHEIEIKTRGIASVTVSKSYVKVAAGAAGGVRVRFTKPAGLDAAQLPIYGGKAFTMGENDEPLPTP
ncbi:hypothetical protein GQ53DRAFT_760308 [Thozetella sp. PMI_491]|nr:hypothetical protein GQ53DRAFT_760308 [Thozetella sp. PMI_491]